MTDPENQEVTFSVTMPHYFAAALAQFVKRIDWIDVARVTEGNQECHEAVEALEIIRTALREIGYGPR